jgi:hypothetical protein
MTSITPKPKKIARLRLTANTPGHPDRAEAKARLAAAIGVTPEPVETAITPTSALIDLRNLQRFDRDGIELVIDSCTGEAFATQKGYARMSGLGVSGIGKRIAKLVSSDSIKKAEMDTGYGVKLVSLIPANLVFKWAITDNPDLAEAMGTAGATVYIHQLAGFKVSSDAISKPAPQPTGSSIPQLPRDIRLVQMVSTLKDLDFELLNPRFKQGLQDLAADMLGISQPRLEAEKTADQDGV